MTRDALVVGINQYPFLKDTSTRKAKHLKTPAGDAEAIAQLLEKYGDFQVQRLPAINHDGKLRVDPNPNLNKLVTLKELQEAITELFHPNGLQVPQTAILFFAGHGLRRSLDGTTEGYLATSDTNPRKGLWGLSLRWLRQLLQESPVRQQIIWLDCCHSGELLNFAETDLGEYEKGRDRCFIVASRDFQVAYAAVEGEHGVLSGALLQGLDPTLRADKWVTNYSLVDFVKQALKDAPQHPICTNSGGQIILTGKQSVISSICPYKGLAYFDFNDEDPKYFHGRTALTNQLLEKVRQSNFLAVLGASGSGKSSVVRAGLLHQLQQGEALPGSDRWKIYKPFTPGEHPLKSLEQVIEVETKQLEPLIKAAAAERVVLVVDQFEEVFTLCGDEAERQQFFECLMGAVERLGSKLCLVIVMRGDFQGMCAEQEYAGLTTKLDQNFVRVKQMSQEELREAITKPAKQVELEIDRELVTQMITDVSGSPGDLPLMQYTLTELWEQRTLNRLTISDYTRLGGVKKALEKQAKKVLKSFSKQEQLVAKQIFLALTQLGEETEDTRRRVRQEDLVTAPQSKSLVEQVIQHLANAKLVVISEVVEKRENTEERITVVDIAHEALIRHWRLLRRWLKKNREALIRKQDIEDAAKEWRDKGKLKDLAYLLQGQRLDDAEKFRQSYANTVPLSSIAQEFVQQSIKERRNRRRLIAGISTTVILGISGFATVAVMNWQEVQKQRIETQKQRVDAQLTASSDFSGNLSASNKKLEALIEGIRAGRALQQSVGVKPDTKNRVVIALQQVVYGVKERNRLEGHSTSVETVSFSPDGRIIASADNDSIRLWNRDGILIKTLKVEGASGIKKLSFSPDSKIIAGAINRIDLSKITSKNLSNSTSDINEVKLWSIDGTLLRTFNGHSDSLESVKFSPDGKMIASASFDKTVKLWSVDGTLLRTLQHSDIVYDVSFSPDGKTIAAASEDKTVKLWNIDGTLLKTLKGNSIRVGSVSFSPDGKMIASSDADGIVKIWSSDGKLLKTFKAHEQSFVSSHVSFSPDSKMIVSGGFRTIKLWSRDGTLIETFEAHNNPILDVSFSPDGKTIASAGGADGTVKLWNRDSNMPQTLASGADGMSFSPDGKTIALSTGKVVKLYSRDGILLKTLEGHKDAVNDVTFSPDGKMIASVSGYSGQGDILLDLAGASYSKAAGLTVNPAAKPKSLKELLQRAQARDQQPHDRSVKLWSIDGTVLKTIDVTKKSLGHQGHNLLATGVTFSPDGKKIVSAGSSFPSENRVIFWSLDGNYGTRLGFLNYNYKSNVNSISLSPDGNTLAAANGKEIELSSGRGEKPKTLKGHNDTVWRVSFSPDGETIASASFDKTVKLWSLDGREFRTLKHSGKVFDVSFSRDGQTIVTAAEDGLRLWNLSGQQLAQFGGTIEFTVGIRFDLDEETKVPTVTKVINNSPAMKAGVKEGDRILAIDGNSTTVKRGDETDNYLINKLIVGEAGTKLILRLSRKGRKDFDVSIVRAKIQFSNTGSIGYTSVRFSPDGQTIAAANQTGGVVRTVNLWSRDGHLLKTLKGHNNVIFSMSFSPDGKMLATASADKTVKLWSLPDGRELRTLKEHSDTVYDVTFSPDGKLLASASYDSIVRVWRIDGTLVKPLLGQTLLDISGNPKSLNFSPDGKTLALGNNSEVQLWSLDGVLLKALAFHKRAWFSSDGNVRTSDGTADGHQDFVNSVSFSPNGKVLASASNDKTLKLWSLDGSLLKTFPQNTNEIKDVRFSPDGKILASAGNDQTVKLWNSEGTLLKTLRGHNGWVNSVSFSPDGYFLASGSNDKTVKLWSIDGTLLKTLKSDDNSVNRVRFSPDGKTLVSATSNTVTLWNFDLDDLLVRGCSWARDYLRTNPNVKPEDRHLCDDIRTSR